MQYTLSVLRKEIPLFFTVMSKQYSRHWLVEPMSATIALPVIMEE